ncbi:MAG: LysM peptidoglycan-binding domain-containing protein [Actinobacteria bacterium]|nr:LysM peptidoglycan-binding domain-containing protein [Actinomycetota bacterium]
MRRRLLSDAVRALGAFVALAALIVGTPWVLAALAGWPLPTEVPSLSAIREALSGATIADSTIVKGVAIVGWIGWLQVVGSAVFEVGAWGRGRAARRLPTAGLIQPLVRQLVVSSLVLVGGLRSTGTAPASPAVAVVATSTVEPAEPDRAAPVNECATAPSPSGSEAPIRAPTYVVQPRDSLWRIAERHLGDGFRWREIFELNRVAPQPDGWVLTDPDLIQPGWVLTLPPDAEGIGAPARTGNGQRGENPARSVPDPAPTKMHQDGAAAAAAPSTTVASPENRGPDREANVNGQDEGGAPLRVGIAGAGLLSAGVVAALARLRRAQQHRRRPGMHVPAVSREVAVTEAAVRSAASNAPSGDVAVAVRALAAQVRSGRAGFMPAIEAVSVGDGTVEILFSERVAADPGPFRTEGEGRVWILDENVREATAEGLAAGGAAPAPALVAVGRTGGREVLVDLEAHSRTVLTGDEHGARALFWMIAWGLATSAWADDLEVVVIGDAPRGVALLDRVRTADAIAEVIDDLEAGAESMTRELTAARRRSTLDARSAESGDAWTPTVVLVAPGVSDPGLDRLLDAAAANHGLCVIFAGGRDVDADRQLVIADSQVSVQPPGIRLDLIDIPDEIREGIGALLETALEDPIDDAAPSVEGRPATLSGDAVRPAWEDPAVIRVRMMGPVEVDGGRTAIDRRKSIEAVTYLTLHREGVDESRLKAALWIDLLPAEGTFNQTMSRARSCLGVAPDGTRHVPHVTDGLYRLSHFVVTDFELLETAFDRAQANRSDQSVHAVVDALRHVRGLPFEGTKAGYEWAHTEGIVAHIETVVADAAHLAAEWFLERGEGSSALLVAEQGLRASPACEILYRDRMRAYDLLGNPAGIESVMSELCRVLETVEPYETLHPETVALYEELARHRRRVG